ncbi:MAG: hypothetical protein K4571_01945 [Deltaproteobacteria bacterium]
MIPRKSNWFFSFLAVVLVLLAVMILHAGYSEHRSAEAFAARRALLGQLPLTDLCLFTEASYTRHWSQADRHTAFQDSPMALEHFPSGSLYGPPLTVMRRFHE